MCGLVKILVVTVSLMMLNFSFAGDKKFVFYIDGKFYAGYNQVASPRSLTLGCFNVELSKALGDDIGELCEYKDSIFSVESFNECEKKCVESKGIKGRNKCIAFVTNKPRKEKGGRTCQLFRDMVIGNNKSNDTLGSSKKTDEYLYYDKAAITLTDRENKSNHSLQGDSILMFNNVHKKFFENNLNHFFGRVIDAFKISGMKVKDNNNRIYDLKVRNDRFDFNDYVNQEGSAVTLSCENPFDEAKLVAGNIAPGSFITSEKYKSLLRKESVCGKWFLDEFFKGSDFFDLSNGQDSLWYYTVKDDRHYVSFECKSCYLVRSQYWIVSLSLQKYLINYYKDFYKEE